VQDNVFVHTSSWVVKKDYDYPFRYQNTESSVRTTKCSTKSNPCFLRVEAIFISLNTNRLLRHKKHSLPAGQGKGRLAMTYSYILTLGMLADNHKKINGFS